MFELDKDVLAVIRQWVQKAENDLKNAAHTLKLGQDCPTDYEPTPLAEARQAVQIAHRVRKQIRKWLPKESLQGL
jgi:hypothetical protein